MGLTSFGRLARGQSLSTGDLANFGTLTSRSKGSTTNAYQLGSGVSRLPIASRVIAATISSIHALSLLIVWSSGRNLVSVMLQDRMACRSSSSPSRSDDSRKVARFKHRDGTVQKAQLRPTTAR